MLNIDLSGKRAFVAGVADDAGFGFAIAKHLAEAGATVCVGTWPPAYTIFTKLIQLGRMRESLQLRHGGELKFERIYPLDADFDTMEDVPAEIRGNRRYRVHAEYTIQGIANTMRKEFGDKPLDIVVHSLANGPEVKKPLLQTSRKGYLAAVSASSYSFVSLVRNFGPLLRPHGAFLNLSFLAAERTVPTSLVASPPPPVKSPAAARPSAATTPTAAASSIRGAPHSSMAHCMLYGLLSPTP